jgi:RNA polymerase sigma-70 factor (ECF subfamily)
MGGRHAVNRGDSGDEPDRADVYPQLVEQHGPALFRYAMGLTGDRVEAQAVVKETWYRVSQEPARVLQRAPSTRAWLIVVARGVFDEWHHHRSGETSAPAPPDPSEATTVVGALDNLSRTHRDILVELFYRGTSLEDAAAARGIPVETLKTRLYYAMRSLRVVLDQRAS